MPPIHHMPFHFPWLVVVTSIASAGFFSLATGLKHRSAVDMPHMDHITPRALWGFFRAMLGHRLWLLGVLSDVGGLGLQLIALHYGGLSLVQPILVSGALFALVVAHKVAGTRISARELGLGALLVVSIVSFLAVSGAIGVHDDGLRFKSAIATGIVAAAVVGTLAVSARVSLRRSGGGRRAAAMLGSATGIVFACTATLMKAVTHVLQVHGPLGVLTSWQIYLLLVTGGLGVMLTQMAFQAGPLSSSLPATASSDPIASIILGVVVFREMLRHDPLSIALSVAALALMAFAAIRLSQVTVHIGEQAEEDASEGSNEASNAGASEAAGQPGRAQAAGHPAEAGHRPRLE